MINYYSAVFDFLSAPSLPNSPEAAIVFGRKDQRVAQALGDLIVPDLIMVAVITGGIGKDSGNLRELGYRSEAEYLRDMLDKDAESRDYTVEPLRILIEPNAKNGGENARFSLALLRGGNLLTPPSVTAVAHATSARRLAEMTRHAATTVAPEVTDVNVKPSNYPFNPDNPADQEEALAEMRRLIEWPSKDWLLPQDDLPANLVDFTLDKTKG